MAAKTKRRKHRKGEVTCFDCGAYRFPHRQFGGKCTGRRWVLRYWAREPHGTHCGGCAAYELAACQVVEGLEAAHHGECLMDHVRSEEVTTPVSWRRT